MIFLTLFIVNAFAETLVKFEDSPLLFKLDAASVVISKEAKPNNAILEIQFAGKKITSEGMNLGGYQDLKSLRDDLLDPKSEIVVIVPRNLQGFQTK